jgi:hypothetical protein
MGKQRIAWTHEDDKKLEKMYLNTKMPTRENFKAFFPDRNKKQCVERYKNHVDPRIKEKKPLTIDQIKMITHFQQKWGNRWTEIGNELGIAPNTIKNYWHVKHRKRSLRDIDDSEDGNEKYFNHSFELPLIFKCLCQVANEELFLLEKE